MQSSVLDSLLKLIETASGTNRLTDTVHARARGKEEKEGEQSREEHKERDVRVSRTKKDKVALLDG